MAEAARLIAMIQELDRVILTSDIPEHSLEEGDIGTLVLVHQGGKGYEVEFVTLDVETVAIVSLHSIQIHPMGRK